MSKFSRSNEVVNRDQHLKLQNYKEEKIFTYFETSTGDIPLLMTSSALVSSAAFLFGSCLIDHLLISCSHMLISFGYLLISFGYWLHIISLCLISCTLFGITVLNWRLISHYLTSYMLLGHICVRDSILLTPSRRLIRKTLMGNMFPYSRGANQ